MDIYDIINLIILAIGVIVTCYSIVMIANVYEKWYILLPILAWGLHLCVLYSLIIYTKLSGTTIDLMFNIPNLTAMWSTVQRLHGVITMLFVTRLLAVEIQYDFFRYEKRKRGKKNSRKEK